MSPRSRYERVHRVRQIEEELAREEFLACERVARRAEEVALALQADVERAQKELFETRVQRRVPPHELLTAQATLESLDRVLALQRARARELAAAAAVLRAAWESARADERTLERLIEREAAARRAEERLGEARALDELAQRPRSPLSAPPGPATGSAPPSPGFDPGFAPGSDGGEARTPRPSSPGTPAADEKNP